MRLAQGVAGAVVPARVGMIPSSTCAGTATQSGPHACGDGPLTDFARTLDGSWSSRVWGWSLDLVGLCEAVLVVPTRMGMVPSTRSPTSSTSCGPRVDGDDSYRQLTSERKARWSLYV